MTRAIGCVIALAGAIAMGLVSSAAPIAQLPASSGTGIVAGALVTDESSSRPVRRAVVRLAGVNTAPRLTTSDDDGRFVFTKLPAGRYFLSATKAGYVATFYGSRHPGHGPGTPISVGDGARVEVWLKIPHGAAITGVVTDEQGQPVANLLVQVLDAEPREAAPKAAPPVFNPLLPDNPPASAMTDDRGVYRVFGLPPGTYLVAALPRLGSNLADEMAAVAVTDDEIRWARAQAAASGRIPPPASPPGRSVTYAPVYFPGLADIGVAQTVPLTVGEERSGISFPLRLVPVSMIGGTIVDSAGQPVPSVTVILVRKPGPRSTAASWLPTSQLTTPRATVIGNEFSFRKVAPGDYLLVARTGGGTRGRGGQPGPLTLWAISDLSVQGQDQQGLVVRMLPGTRVSGSVIFEGSSLRPPVDLTTMSITLTPVLGLPGLPIPSALMAADGTWTFQSVAAALSDLRIVTPGPAAPAPHWMLKSVTVNGRDVSDTPIDLTNLEEVTGLTITFTDLTTEIAGKVLGADGAATTAYSAVVFPADRALWSPGSRRTKAVPLATNGTFSIADLPPGRYCLAVVDDLDPADLSSADFLTQLQTAAATITLAEGERKTQDLRVGKSE